MKYRTLGALVVLMVLIAGCSSGEERAAATTPLDRLAKNVRARGALPECFMPVISSLGPSDVEALNLVYEDAGIGTLTLEPDATRAIVAIGECARNPVMTTPGDIDTTTTS